MPAGKRPAAPTTVAELVERLVQAEGELRVPDPSDAERRRWRQTLFLASTEGGLPEGKRLRFSGRDRGDMAIRLVDDTPENQPRPPVFDMPPVPVPETLRGLHPLLAATRDAVGKPREGRVSTFGTKGVLHLNVAPGSVKRVLRLAQALASEAERQGGGLRPARCGVGLALRDQVYELVFTEENDRRPHEPTAAELRAFERASRPHPSGYVPYVRPLPKYDYFPSGRLSLRTGHDTYGTVILANDRKRWTFESRLPLALQKIEELTTEAENRYAEALQEMQARERAWQAAVDDARRRWDESQRRAALDDLLARRRRRIEIEALLDELRTDHEPEPGSPGGAWLQWIADHARALDPAAGPLAPPEQPEPSCEDLQALLGNRWSIHGPEHGIPFDLRRRLGQPM